jgi:putative transposase
MPNHVHLLIWPSENSYDIGKILQSINGSMSRRYSRLLTRINPEIRSGFLETTNSKQIFRFWQRGGGFDRNLYNSDAVHACICYIENNPVRANIVRQANEYRWSSAWNIIVKEKWRPELERQAVPVKLV